MPNKFPEATARPDTSDEEPSKAQGQVVSKRPYCVHCHGKGWFAGLEIPCAWCNPGGEWRAL